MEQTWAFLSAIWEWSRSVLALLGIAGVTLTGVVSAAYALFKLLGEKWLNQKFAQQLEAFKAEQNRELEKLKHRINGVFDRTKRLHDREFEALPDVWGKLVEAKSWSGSYLALFKQYPDIGRMLDEDLYEFLKEFRFSEAQKRNIKDSASRQRTFEKLFDIYKYHDVMDKLVDANSTLSKGGIFIIPALRADMKALLEILHAAVVERQINDEHNPVPRLVESYDKLRTEGEALFIKIEEAVVARLWEATTTEV